ncbi:uncharacterized protein METZ01_LOCUS277429, partial [marine metagenome]
VILKNKSEDWLRMIQNRSYYLILSQPQQHDLEMERLSAPAQFNCGGCQ